MSWLCIVPLPVKYASLVYSTESDFLKSILFFKIHATPLSIILRMHKNWLTQLAHFIIVNCILSVLEGDTFFLVAQGKIKFLELSAIATSKSTSSLILKICRVEQKALLLHSSKMFA